MLYFERFRRLRPLARGLTLRRKKETSRRQKQAACTTKEPPASRPDCCVENRACQLLALSSGVPSADIDKLGASGSSV